MSKNNATELVSETRQSPLTLGSEQFRRIGYQLIDTLAARMDDAHDVAVRPVVQDPLFSDIDSAGEMPQQGADADEVFMRFTKLLSEQGVSTSHPRFLAYIMGAASDTSALADFLASAVNPPVTSSATSPLSTMIEAQTIQWMAQLLGFADHCGGLFVSGGSIANLVALKVALYSKTKMATASARQANLSRYRIYASNRVHSSIAAAADLSGFAPEVITTVDTTASDQLSLTDLNDKIDADIALGLIPLMVVGIAGCTSLGIVDPLDEMAILCAQRDIWFHVDAAYGGLAILSPQAPAELAGLRRADSVTIDPHKWMYAAADVGCILTKSREVLINTFSQSGDYYSTDNPGDAATLQFRDLGPQTTRSFRALKVRMSLEIAGRQGYQQMISEDIALAQYLYSLASDHPLIQACSCHLSITTFRFVPETSEPLTLAQLNTLNQTLLVRLQQQGQSFPSHTWHQGQYLIRVCVVNLNTTKADIEQLFDEVITIGLGVNL